MRLLDFNHPKFTGFSEGEDILIDTGILYAYYNKYDAYYSTVTKLFNEHILHNDNALFLYVNPLIVNEIAHLARDPLKQYLKSHPTEKSNFTASDREVVEHGIVDGVNELIENEVLLILEGDKDSVLKQISLYKELGAADAVNASIANLYGTSFLTVDSTLARNILSERSSLPNIKNVYYTNGRNRDYY